MMLYNFNIKMASFSAVTATKLSRIWQRTFNYTSSRQMCLKQSLEHSRLPKPPSYSVCTVECASIRRFATKPLQSGNKKVPINWISLGLLVFAGGGVVLYVQKLRKEKEQVAEKKRTQSLGKAALGGPFTLTDHNGKERTEQDFLGQWVLIYFGFTFCPDICPDELEKMAKVIDKIDQTNGLPKLQPLFITVDPKRDSCSVLKTYLKDFHPRIIGLTGNHEQILQATKAYRVYYSVGPSDDDNDYLVDHTIIMYLVNPKGEFVNYYGQNKTAEEITAGIGNEMIKYNRSNR